jgi:hypothetical protein
MISFSLGCRIGLVRRIATVFLIPLCVLALSVCAAKATVVTYTLESTDFIQFSTGYQISLDGTISFNSVTGAITADLSTSSSHYASSLFSSSSFTSSQSYFTLARFTSYAYIISLSSGTDTVELELEDRSPSISPVPEYFSLTFTSATIGGYSNFLRLDAVPA